MSEIGKTLWQDFENTLCAEYERYCARHRKTPNHRGFLAFMTDRDLLECNRIRHYTVVSIYADTENTRASEAVHRLSDRFKISERTVYNILRREKEKIRNRSTR